MNISNPLKIITWCKENATLLEPPIGNVCIWKDDWYIIMLVGGPNSRHDYHTNPTPEIFYQVKGSIILKIKSKNSVGPKIIKINEGDIYILPPNIPHLPMRPANTIGLVIEHTRKPSENDTFEWFCKRCFNRTKHVQTHINNLGSQLKHILKNDAEYRICCKCRKVDSFFQISRL